MRSVKRNRIGVKSKHLTLAIGFPLLTNWRPRRHQLASQSRGGFLRTLFHEQYISIHNFNSPFAWPDYLASRSASEYLRRVFVHCKRRQPAAGWVLGRFLTTPQTKIRAEKKRKRSRRKGKGVSQQIWATEKEKRKRGQSTNLDSIDVAQ
jgi:hypothetical protein